ncbi:hypothetical protein IVB14_20955 [Bradyrhizobium sp. 180]|uniref:hypothetical protein n=1 Tax=Bradyrhizobium sp. 180 TaxID=2782650 RepID=UPI001FFA0950|nr:hypothetical protein [Bradyrhizobium sp. 180]MCK1492824.1 hypothetical protein [Bradyrhizobium sp. 180]
MQGSKSFRRQYRHIELAADVRQEQRHYFAHAKNMSYRQLAGHCAHLGGLPDQNPAVHVHGRGNDAVPQNSEPSAPRFSIVVQTDDIDLLECRRCRFLADFVEKGGSCDSRIAVIQSV